MEFNTEFISKPASVWQRFLARNIDLWLINIPVIACLNYVFGKLDSTLFWRLQIVLPFILVMILEILYESISLSAFGTTVGKKAFGIRVMTEEGQNLSFSESLIRTIKVWTIGLGLSIPYITIITRIVAYLNFNNTGTTFWDKNKYRVHQVKQVNTVLSGLAFFTMFIIYVVVILQPNIGEAFTGNASLENRIDELFTAGEYEEVINSFEANEDGSDISDELYSQIGYAYMMVGDYQNAKKAFENGVDVNSNPEILDTLLNNLSWAYYNLGEYDTALNYSEAGLDLEPQDAIEYSNYGNALLALNRDEDALTAYEEGLSYDENCTSALYGMGTIYYDHGDYEKAMDYFNKYIVIEEDSDVYCYLALSQLYLDENAVKVVDYLNKASAVDTDTAKVQDTWATYYNYVGDYPSAIKIYNEELLQDPENYDLHCNLAEAYGYNNNADLAFDQLNKAMSLRPEEPRAYTLEAQLYYMQDDAEKIEEVIKQMLDQATNEANALYNAGEIYYKEGNYLEAARYYELSIAENNASEECYEGAVAALYYAKRYTRCKNTALEALSKFNNANINYYLAYVYSNLSQSDQAINYYQQALELKPDDVYLLTDIGWEYYYKQDYEETAKWLGKALEQDSSNQRPNDLKDALAVKDQSLITQISKFLEDNYLYIKLTDNYHQTKEKLVSKKDQTIDDVYELVGTVYNPDDLFTYILSGQDYNYYEAMHEEKTVEYSHLDNNKEYIRISTFMPNTSNEVLDIIENMDATEQKDLIIDLRDNYGGDTNSGCNILDFLLGECVVCNLIDKSGYTNQYYSDATQIVFKNIYVLTNENSASCSELVTLGLKTYLDNVTVVGERTYGKGVGQVVYEDKEREFALFLVNHYWNVREINIMDVGIEPDVPVNSDKLEDYLALIQ